MYARIKEYMPEMEVQYSDDIIHYHDMLTKTDRRIKIKNEKITYSEEELNHYDYEEEKIKIGLAKTTNEIVSSGTQMNICVPSYANSALDKKLYILFVYVKDVPTVCIELGFDDKTIEAKQVKAYSNYKVEESMAKFIAKYFNERKINYKNCHDLNGFEGLEKSKTPRSNKKYYKRETIKARDIARGRYV